MLVVGVICDVNVVNFIVDFYLLIVCGWDGEEVGVELVDVVRYVEFVEEVDMVEVCGFNGDVVINFVGEIYDVDEDIIDVGGICMLVEIICEEIWI